MRRYVGRREGKRRDSRKTAMGFASIAAGAMSQLYRLMAEPADRRHRSQLFAMDGGDKAALAERAKAVARFLCATAWWSERHGSDGAALAGLGFASAVTERSEGVRRRRPSHRQISKPLSVATLILRVPISTVCTPSRNVFPQIRSPSTEVPTTLPRS